MINNKGGREEYDELQEIIRKTESQLLEAVFQNTPQAQAPETANGRIRFSGASTQWEIEFNDRYTACGGTTQKLPAAVYKVSADNYGNIHFTRTPILNDKLIDLKDTAASEIIEGIRVFWDKYEKFKELGILYKRGVLLWGPPGGGKTCLVMQLMQELIATGGIVIICENPTITIAALDMVRRIEPERRLIVVEEDIEELMKAHGEHKLLALLDGENQIANVVHIATTNYPGELGARIINRPSRFDEVKKIGMPTALARKSYFEAIAPKPFEDQHKWVMDTEGMSIAHLRELVVAVFCLGRGYEETLDRLKKMSIRPKSHEEGFSNGQDFGLAAMSRAKRAGTIAVGSGSIALSIHKRLRP